MNAQLKMIDPIVANIGEPKRKTVADYQQELAVMEAELATCNELAMDRGARSYRLQNATTMHVLGTGTTADLQAAQAAMDESVEALIRRSHLEASIGELRDAIRWSQGQERRQFCESVRSEFNDLHASYVEDCKALHEKFRQLHHLSIKYAGLTTRQLLEEPSYRLNLPPLLSQYDSPQFMTGSRVR